MWRSTTITRAALCLLCLSCRLKETPSAPGSVYYESWVFVGRDGEQRPFVISAEHRKTQSDKRKVELEAKIFMSKERQTRRIIRERSSREGLMSKEPLAGPMLLGEVECEGGRCLQMSFAAGFVAELRSEPLPKFTPHDWRQSRIGDAITRATLRFEQERIEGCLFVERGFSRYGPPAPFFGDFDWFALQDDAGDCWLLSEGTLVGSFALSRFGAASSEVAREVTQSFIEKKTGQRAPEAWSVSAPALSLTAALSATSGYQETGAILSPTKKVLYGHGLVEGDATLRGQSRAVVGWVRHVSDE